MKWKINKQTVLISAIVGVMCVTGVCTALYLTRDKSKPVTGIYQEQPLPDYTQFLPENAIKPYLMKKAAVPIMTGR